DITPAVTAAQPEIVEFLLRHGADVNGPASRRGRTPLMSVGNTRWNYEVAQLLVTHGARLDSATPTGETALIAAVKRHDEGLVALLLRDGADPTVGNYHNHSVVEIAASEHQSGMVRLLCAHDIHSSLCAGTTTTGLLAQNK